MIDLHCHLLPGVDDGPAEIEETVRMGHLAAADGCTAIIATPHLRHESWWNDDRPRLERALLEVRRALEGVIEVFLGGEIALNSHSAAELEELTHGALLTLAGSRYVLLELHPQGLGPDPREQVYELQRRGWFPIIAHPERNPWLIRDPDLLEELVIEGAHLQLTAMSLSGAWGRQLQQICEGLVEAGLVAFVASDAHGAVRRPPGLTAAYQHATELWGEPQARTLFTHNPKAVVENRPLHTAHLSPVPATSPDR